MQTRNSRKQVSFGEEEFGPLPPKDKEELPTLEQLREQRDAVYAGVSDSIQEFASWTRPDLSVTFILFFLALAYFHESHFGAVGSVLVTWSLLQVTALSMHNDEFKNNLFWNLFGLLGNVAFYLFIGYCWSMIKLYVEIWQGHVAPVVMNQIRTCISDEGTNGCVYDVLLKFKWDIVRWMTTWPVSMFYTLSRDPLRIFTDAIFMWSERRYMRIITAAVQAFDHTSGSSDSSVLLWTVATIVIYLALGYLWTHIKLFVDVWQQALPPSMEEEIRAVYAGDKNYWHFVRRIKWLVIQWLVTWPFSVVYTIFKHPVRILADFIYRLSHRKYMWIVGKAMETREKTE